MSRYEALRRWDVLSRTPVHLEQRSLVGGVMSGLTFLVVIVVVAILIYGYHTRPITSSTVAKLVASADTFPIRIHCNHSTDCAVFVNDDECASRNGYPNGSRGQIISRGTSVTMLICPSGLRLLHVPDPHTEMFCSPASCTSDGGFCYTASLWSMVLIGGSGPAQMRIGNGVSVAYAWALLPVILSVSLRTDYEGQTETFALCSPTSPGVASWEPAADMQSQLCPDFQAKKGAFTYAFRVQLSPTYLHTTEERRGSIVELFAAIGGSCSLIFSLGAVLVAWIQKCSEPRRAMSPSFEPTSLSLNQPFLP